MTQSSELERAKARIRALAEKTVQNGCTDAEALAAAEMVGRLLDRYMLTMDEVQLRSSPCIQAVVPMAGRRRGPIDGCVPAIARFCHCIVWLEEMEAKPPSPALSDPPGHRAGHRPGKRYVYFGFDADVQMAVYLHAIIARAIATETEGFKQASRQLKATGLRLATRSFQHGLVTRLADRLATLHQARETDLCTSAARGTALVLAKHNAVAEAFRETKIRLSTRGTTAMTVDHRAFAAGALAGDGINLGRPVEDASPELLG